jgi:hypothetical protein
MTLPYGGNCRGKGGNNDKAGTQAYEVAAL